MAGIVIRIAPRQLYVLQPPATMTGTCSQQTIWQRRIDTSQYQNGVLLLRLHTADSFVTGHTITVAYAADGWTDDDPSTTNWELPGAQVIAPNGLAMTGGSDGAPFVRYAALTSPFPSLLMVNVELASTVTTQLKVELSCDLQLKGE